MPWCETCQDILGREQPVYNYLNCSHLDGKDIFSVKAIEKPQPKNFVEKLTYTCACGLAFDYYGNLTLHRRNCKTSFY